MQPEKTFVRYSLLAFAIFCLFISCAEKKYKNPHIEIKTRYGDIEVELFSSNAPKTVEAFLSYVDSGYYKGASFYRALNDDNQQTGNSETAMLQGGIWKTKHAMKIPGISHESTAQTKLTHKDGTISLARQETGSANTEFFICIGDQSGFDYGGTNNPDGQGYAAFGQVVKGMEIVRQLHNKATNGDLLEEPIEISNIVRL